MLQDAADCCFYLHSSAISCVYLFEPLLSSHRVGWCLPSYFPRLFRVVANLKIGEAPSHCSSKCNRKAQKETDSGSRGGFEQATSCAGQRAEMELCMGTLRLQVPVCSQPSSLPQTSFLGLAAPFPALCPWEHTRWVSALSPRNPPAWAAGPGQAQLLTGVACPRCSKDHSALPWGDFAALGLLQGGQQKVAG